MTVPQGTYAGKGAVEDASAAMAWMRDSAGLYNIEASRIAIGGGSAGALISQLQAYNNPPAAVAPQAVLSYLGAMYGTEGTILSGAPPAFVVASSDDPVVPFDLPLGTQAMVDQMNAVGVYNEFYVQTGVGHEVDFFGVFNGQTLLENNIDFLAHYLVPEPSTFALSALGFAALAAYRWRRRRAV